MSKLIERRSRLISEYTEKARYYKIRELPGEAPKLVAGNRALVFANGRLTFYVQFNGLWRKRLEAEFPPGATASASPENMRINAGNRVENIAVGCDGEEYETYFIRDVTISNDSDSELCADFTTRDAYFPEGPLCDFTYVSLKWINRKQNLDAYPYKKDDADYLGVRANNQIFYAVSGPLYSGCAFKDTSLDWKSDLERDDAYLFHKFFLRTPVKIAPRTSFATRLYWFAGAGRENHLGHISNVLWRINAPGNPINIPQTDMADFVEKTTMGVWPRSELHGETAGDHYGAHFFSDFFGQFKEGYRPKDQFGCSWLAYDLLKAHEFFRRFKASGDPSFRERAKGIVNFYLYNHFAGKSRLTFPFHTGEFMHDILPFVEKCGWGAPFEADHLDSLALPEMIDDALVLWEDDKTLFQDDYPKAVLNDILSLQQPDGHFRRLYDSDLKPLDKPGWISQYSQSQTWIPVLLKLAEITSDKRPFDAAIRCAERAELDLRESGLFSMGGCQTDYPCNWDVDGYRTMLKAFLTLYKKTGEQRWLDDAENVQLFCNQMQMSYNVSSPKDSFYGRIGWCPKGMIATSFYPYPDYTRTQCTADGNQSVAWIGFLLLELYRATGKKIYAERGIAAFRQVMVYRDEKSLENNPHKKELLWTIFENNPQMDDESGLYRVGFAPDTYSAFIDLYWYVGEILRTFGGVFIDPVRKHAFGIDCVKALSADFGRNHVSVKLENELDRARRVSVKIGNSESTVELGPREIKEIRFDC